MGADAEQIGQGRGRDRTVRAGIVVTGTEVITGRIRDANGPWVSEQLAGLGVEVAHIIVVADRPDDLEDALRFLAAEGMDLIVTSGGLGPTADDLTAEIVGRFAGREMKLDTEMEAKIAEIIRAFARRRGWSDEESMIAANRKQAMVPEGAIALDPVGTAPGLVVPADGTVVVVLPGPPRELQPMWPVALATAPVREALDRATPLHGLTMRMFGVPESEIAKSLREIDAEGVPLDAVEITTCLRRGEIEIDVRYRDETEATAMQVRDALAARHRRETFSLEGETIDEQVAELLRGHKLGLAESCSGGMMAARITDRAGASEYMAGSVVSYSNEAKSELLGVDPALDRGVRGGLAAGRRGDGDRGAGALRGRRRGVDHRHRRAGRRQRGEAGRLRLLQRPARRRHRDRPRAGHSRRPRRHPRTLGAGRDAPAAPAARRRRRADLGRHRGRSGRCPGVGRASWP